MATGQMQGGGLFAEPDVPELGPMTWAQMSGVHPDSPLVGGRGVPTGGVDPDYKYRQVALGKQDPMAGAVGGAPMKAHFSELWNFRGNPIGWLLIASIIYLGLAHISLNASVRGRAGKGRAGVAGALGVG